MIFYINLLKRQLFSILFRLRDDLIILLNHVMLRTFLTHNNIVVCSSKVSTMASQSENKVSYLAEQRLAILIEFLLFIFEEVINAF